jgi:hypothetical protein
MEKERTEAAGGTCSYQSDIFIIWKRIWGMKVPNSLENFLWRACHDILSTKDNLKRRGINLDLSCIFCNCERETVQKLFKNGRLDLMSFSIGCVGFLR